MQEEWKYLGEKSSH